MGGGSSNAAAILKSINTFFDDKIPNRELKKLAEQIGSDVPFFIEGKTSHVSGCGEIINPINIDLNYYILLVLPQMKISTAEAYKSLRIHLTKNDNDFKFKS